MTSQDRWLLPDGIDELLPERAALAERMRREILDLFAGWGYQLVIPPLIEFTDSLLIGLGEDLSLQSFRLTDQISGKPMAVRADITSQVARIDAHSMKAKGVNRLCYAGSVLHALPRSLSASRCPIQAGAEIYGAEGLWADTEVISLMLETLQKVDSSCNPQVASAANMMHQLTLDLGHVDICRAIEQLLRRHCSAISDQQIAQIFDAVQRKAITDLKDLVPNLGASDAIGELLYKLPTLCGDTGVLDAARSFFLNADSALIAADIKQRLAVALDELAEIAQIITQRFPVVALYLDLAESRGYSYHTGLVFAAYAAGHSGALANGGRYNEVGKVFGAARPATGFNTDVKALIDLALSADINEGSNSLGDPIFAPAVNDVDLWRVIQELRANGKIVVVEDSPKDSKAVQRLVKTPSGWQIQ